MIRPKYKIIYVTLLAAIIIPLPTQAVIPPDFIFNIGAQVAQFFSIILIFITAAFGTFFNFFKTRFYTIKHKKIFIAAIVLGSIIFALVASYAYAVYRQRTEYQQWLEDSDEFTALQDVQITNTNNDIINETADSNDLLVLEDNKAIQVDTSAEKFVSAIKAQDDVTQFITTYYKYIATGEYQKAYDISKKSVDYETFVSWYAKIDKITLDKLVRIDDNTSSLELTLYEGDTITRYATVMTVSAQETLPRHVENSVVTILDQASIKDDVASIDEAASRAIYAFFEEHADQNLYISNDEFEKIITNENDDYIVLDARENIEFETGHFPGSTHIRFADLKAGKWVELPQDKFIYVLCWSGIRGKEVAEFLRTKKIVASYLQNGASGWVDFGGQWDGDINFSEAYTDKKYQTVFDTADVEGYISQGVQMVDTREPAVFDQWHIPGSVNIPTMYTATIDMEDAFAQVPPQSKIITMCDDYVNCFDAKLTGMELERRGHTFLGRYNTPWEYEK